MDDTPKKKKILIVDDDATQLSFAHTILISKYDVTTAASGDEALEYLYHGCIPDIILLDILMPEMHGFEVYKRIRAISLLQNIPVIFVTSVSGATEVQQAWDIGAADYVTKPYSKNELLRKINDALEQN